ncbi:hypothetical protein QJS04_geneDACA010951 [Acorus gramineus]|uniref:Uncharacterized protein n=1 Tax=Acorus gramineus TaxID=55184 RepID=A0AAV9BGZ3_ACOGR|nr:hypothetical protein QJS04_geneDACA010951 [Acorus gramineus]
MGSNNSYGVTMQLYATQGDISDAPEAQDHNKESMSPNTPTSMDDAQPQNSTTLDSDEGKWQVVPPCRRVRNGVRSLPVSNSHLNVADRQKENEVKPQNGELTGPNGLSRGSGNRQNASFNSSKSGVGKDSYNSMKQGQQLGVPSVKGSERSRTSPVVQPLIRPMETSSGKNSKDRVEEQNPVSKAIVVVSNAAVRVSKKRVFEHSANDHDMITIDQDPTTSFGVHTSKAMELFRRSWGAEVNYPMK